MSDINPAAEVPSWTLGWRMKRALAHGHMGVEEMATEVGYDRRTVSRWLNEKGSPPRPVVLMRWAMKCGVPYAWLIGQDDNGPSDVGVDGSSCSHASSATVARIYGHQTAA